MTNPIKEILVILAFGLGELQAQGDVLRIHVIKPRTPIQWTSPRSLTLTSLLNSLGHDYAPIGHFIVDLSCSRANRFGVKRVLTGMERKDKKASQKILLKEGLGLGSLTYSFEGALQTAEEAKANLHQARKDHRLSTIQVHIEPERCDQMMEFLGNWIEAGSYQVYGGGKSTAAGEGAGCADFAMHFMKIALGRPLNPDWVAKVQVPASLVRAGSKKIPLFRILAQRHWALDDEPGFDFAIPDTDRLSQWLENRPETCGLRCWLMESGPSEAQPPFQYRYPTTEPPEQIWLKL